MFVITIFVVAHLLQKRLSALHDYLNLTLSKNSTDTRAEMDRLHQRMDERLKENAQLIQDTHRGVGERLDKNATVASQVYQQLGHLQESSKRIESVGVKISELQEILRAPKLRGGLGELLLEDLLSQILPRPHFEMQHAFSGGQIVDAVIFLANGHLVPIDAKFPLEDFRRMTSPGLLENQEKEHRKAFAQSFKKHVDDIAARYIRPEEGTLDFALMYVPAENVYYEAILRDDKFSQSLGVNNYAIAKRVIPVSPNSLYAYLQAIALGLKGLRIEEKAREIFGSLNSIRIEVRKLTEDFTLVGKHLSNATSAYVKSENKLYRVSDKIAGLEGSQEELSPPDASGVSMLPPTHEGS